MCLLNVRLWFYLAVAALLIAHDSYAQSQSAVETQQSDWQLLKVDKVWDAADHNAFTDLVRFRDRWYLAFREGDGHVSPKGQARVLVSNDTETWNSVAVLTSDRGDVRDPKLSVTPAGELMVTTAVAIQPPGVVRHQSYAWFSRDGADWSDPVAIGDENFWIWRTSWRDGIAYAIGYATTKERSIRLYRSTDGRNFDTLIETMKPDGYANESSIEFAPDGTAWCLLRRDGQSAVGMLGVAKRPYDAWTWQSLDRRIGGPKLLLLDDGRFLAGVRLYDEKVRTSLCWIDPQSGRLDECLTLPSGGDTSYPGLVMHEGRLYISYYSSHEGKTSIYVAQARPIDRNLHDD